MRWANSSEWCDAMFGPPFVSTVTGDRHSHSWACRLERGHEGQHENQHSFAERWCAIPDLSDLDAVDRWLSAAL